MERRLSNDLKVLILAEIQEPVDIIFRRKGKKSPAAMEQSRQPVAERID
jgi:hypothetical protein